ncbi:MAG: glycosyltransferase family 32 protein [Acutalibacteraceae bacterium]
MIEKKIHYCWFGRGEKPKKAQKCIASWKKYCPDYEIIEWNEDNFDVGKYPYAAYCLENKKYAFLSDFVRLVVINDHGGLYFDTDVELIRSPDELLQYDAFYGFETDEFVNTGEGFGAVSGHETVKKMLQLYLDLKPDENGAYPIVGCPHLNTEALLCFGLERNGKEQTVAGAKIFPADYFNPYDDPTGRLNLTENTVSIHWYSKSWMSRKSVVRSVLTKPLHRLFGKDCFEKIKK